MSLRLGTGIGPLGSAGMVGLWGASSIIENIQEIGTTFGVSSASGTGTITSVDLNRSICVSSNAVNYTNDDGLLGPGYTLARVKLSSTTTITGENYSAGSAYSNLVRVQIVQFRPGVIKSIQRGTVSGSSALLNVSLTAVNRAKTIVLVAGCTANTLGAWNVPTGAMREFGASGLWTSDTNFQFEKASGSYITNINYEVVEFF